METQSQNPYLPIIIDEIKKSPIYLRFLDCLKNYGIDAIWDCHAHVCSDRDFDMEETPARLMPKSPFSIRDVNHLYDELFRNQGIRSTTVVFDTPLPIYDLARKNNRLLSEMAALDPQERAKLIPFAVITPDMTTSQIEGYVAGGMRGFKMTPRTSPGKVKRGAFSDVTLTEMLNPDALKIADAHQSPMVIHLPQLVVAPRMNPSLKEELLQIIHKYPRLKIILAHLGQAQTPAKITDLLQWIAENHLNEHIWLDISAVTIPSVIEMALCGHTNLLFGTDIDFSLTERGRYIMLKYSNGNRILANPDDNGTTVTSLVSQSFGKQLLQFAAENGIDLDAPMIVFQMEGILNAVEGLKKRGKPASEIALILKALFSGNTEALFAKG